MTLGADPTLYPTPLPPSARRVTLSTARGPLAALDVAPDGAGEVRGTAVLVPGFSGSKEDFVPMLGALAAQGYRVVAYDQRGQFESPGPTRPQDYGTARFAADLTEVIAYAGPGPVHLLGHSFGGLVVQRAVAAAPDSVRSLTLLCTGPGSTDFAGGRMVRPMMTLLRLGGGRALWAAMKRPLAKAGVAAEQQAWLRHRLRYTHKANLIGIIRALLAEPSRVRELAATDVPFLVMHGENDEPWAPAAQSRMARDLGARYVVIADAGHTPNEEKPEETAKALTDFWTTVDERGGTGQVPAATAADDEAVGGKG
ncbi:MAG: alpha/beta hydrolase [Streptomycetaceae bacterium]|nr:alpha/beta hydrolase [Streptomycetaceae bacterium]